MGTVMGRLVHQGQRRHNPHCLLSPLSPCWKTEAQEYLLTAVLTGKGLGGRLAEVPGLPLHGSVTWGKSPPLPGSVYWG